MPARRRLRAGHSRRLGGPSRPLAGRRRRPVSCGLRGRCGPGRPRRDCTGGWLGPATPRPVGAARRLPPRCGTGIPPAGNAGRSSCADRSSAHRSPVRPGSSPVRVLLPDRGPPVGVVVTGTVGVHLRPALPDPHLPGTPRRRATSAHRSPARTSRAGRIGTRPRPTGHRRHLGPRAARRGCTGPAAGPTRRARRPSPPAGTTRAPARSQGRPGVRLRAGLHRRVGRRTPGRPPDAAGQDRSSRDAGRAGTGRPTGADQPRRAARPDLTRGAPAPRPAQDDSSGPGVQRPAYPPP